MTPASLLGFCVVFVLVCGAASIACAVLGRLVRGAAAERRAALLAAVLPVTLAGAITGVLAIASLIGPDHCDTHGHHAHLCLLHGAVWSERAWAVALVAAAGAVVLVRAILLVIELARGWRFVARLRHVPCVDGVRLVESARPFCFVAGLRQPCVFVSTAAREALATDEWDAMLAHERSHIAHRDLRHRLGLELALLFAAPLVGIGIRERWDTATERLRDADAARHVSADSVASALVRMVRAGIEPGFVAAFGTRADRLLAVRVEELLDAAPLGESAARRLGVVAVTGCAAAIICASVFAGPLHHALETLLG